MNHQTQPKSSQDVQQKDHHQANKYSEQRQVDVLIIGGGPASLGLLVNAVKTNRLNELLQGDSIAIIERGLNFGGGLLGKYGINSNTSGGGFLKCTFKKTQKTKGADKNANDDLNNNTKKRNKNGKQKGGQQKKGDNILQNPYAQNLAQSQKHFVQKEDTEILAPYRDLITSHIAKTLKNFGKNTAPLPLIGHFLNYAGNHLLSFIYQTTKKKIFFPLHKVVSIQLMQNGEVLTKVKKLQLELEQSEQGNFIREIETDQVIVFRSKAIIVANGGVQGIHPDLFSWFPFLDPGKVIASDEFLRSEGYMKCIEEINQRQLKKVVIIGGSHSGFSCAWMLLNGPSAYYNNNAGIQIDQLPHAQRKYAKNCPDCCHCGLQQQKQKKQGAQSSNNQFSPSEKANSQQSCQCMCICFGLFDYDDWQFDYSTLPQDIEIQILYRDHIKVFYNRVADAEFDGYTEFESEKFSKKDGYLYSFTGLRGDAKELYLKIMRGQENRVKLIQAINAEQQSPYVEQADLVIWACGYQTNGIPFKDTDRKKLVLSQKVPNTQYDVDGKCRIMLADGHVLQKCFACGIGYPVRTKDGMICSNPQISNPRADSFSLYMNFVGDNLLKSILPKNKITKNSIHKALPNTKKNGQNTEGNMNKNQYQQILKQRIQQYRNKTNDNCIDEKQQVVLRHKSLNIREDVKNTLCKKQFVHKENSENQDHNQNNINIKQIDTNTENYNSCEEQQDLEQQQLLIVETKQQSQGSKSVDRAKNGGGFQNKLSQMARSPQLLQKKQQIMKMKNSNNQQNSNIIKNIYAENQNLNQDLMPLLNIQESKQNLTQKRSQKLKKAQNQAQLNNSKSPYNPSQKFARQESKTQNPQQVQTNRQGRDMVVRSSQSGRIQDQIQSNDPPYKTSSRISQIGSQNKEQRGNRISLMVGEKMVFNNQLYASIGGNNGHQNLFGQVNHFDQNSQRITMTSIKKTEFPPILHPLAQNHYVGYNNQQYQERQSHTAQSSTNEIKQSQDEYYPDINNGERNNKYNRGQLAFTQSDKFNYEYTIQNNDTTEKYIDQLEGKQDLQKQNNLRNQVLYLNEDCLTESDQSYEEQNQEYIDVSPDTKINTKNSQIQIKQNPMNQYQKEYQLQNNDILHPNLNYEDDNFENPDISEEDEDPFQEDVSSEGSCVNNSSYMRQQQSLKKDCEEEIYNPDDSMEIPNEEFDQENSPRKELATIPHVQATKKINPSSEQQSTTNKTDYSKNSFAQISKTFSNNHQLKSLNKAVDFDIKQGNKQQLSPILQERRNSKKQINSQSNQKEQLSARENRDEDNITNLKKKKYLNPQFHNTNNNNVNSSQETGTRITMQKNFNNSIKQQRLSKSIKQGPIGNASIIESNQLRLQHQNKITTGHPTKKISQNSHLKSYNNLGGTFKHEKKLINEDIIGQRTPGGKLAKNRQHINLND